MQGSEASVSKVLPQFQKKINADNGKAHRVQEFGKARCDGSLATHEKYK